MTRSIIFAISLLISSGPFLSIASAHSVETRSNLTADSSADFLSSSSQVLKQEYPRESVVRLAKGTAVGSVQSAEAIAQESQISRLSRRTTVQIKGATEGSGVLVERDGNRYTVVTVWHVISPNKAGEEISIQTHDGKKFVTSIALAKRIGGLDLAIIYFDSQERYDLASISQGELEQNDLLYVSGYPLSGKLFRHTVGTLIANADVGIDQGYQMLYSNSTKAGMSGGPIFDSNLSLVGIHGRGEVSQDKKLATFSKTNINQGIPIFYYEQFRNGKPLRSKRSTPLTWSDYYALHKGADQHSGAGDVRQTQIRLLGKMIELRPKDVYAYTLRGALIYSLDPVGKRMNQDTLKALELATEWMDIKDKAKENLRKDRSAESLRLFKIAEEYVTESGSEDYLFKAALFNAEAANTKNKGNYRAAIIEAEKGIELEVDAYKDGRSAMTLVTSDGEMTISGLYRELARAYFGLGLHRESLNANQHSINWLQRHRLVGGTRLYEGLESALRDQYLSMAVSAGYLRDSNKEACAYYAMAKKHGANNSSIVNYCSENYPLVTGAIPAQIHSSSLPEESAYISFPLFRNIYNSKDYQSAKKILDDGLKHEPDLAKAYFFRGIVNKDLGDFSGCIRDHTSAIQLVPGLRDAYSLRGQCRYESGDFDGALNDYAYANSIESDAFIFSEVGYMYLVSHKKEGEEFFAKRGLNVSLKAHQLEPLNPDYLAQIARFYFLMNDQVNGCLFLEKATKLGDAWASELLSEIDFCT